MSIDDLNKNLDSVISKFQSEAATASNYCDDEFTCNAINGCNQAIATALTSFKNELLTYLKNG